LRYRFVEHPDALMLLAGKEGNRFFGPPLPIFKKKKICHVFVLSVNAMECRQKAAAASRAGCRCRSVGRTDLGPEEFGKRGRGHRLFPPSPLRKAAAFSWVSEGLSSVPHAPAEAAAICFHSFGDGVIKKEFFCRRYDKIATVTNQFFHGCAHNS